MTDSALMVWGCNSCCSTHNYAEELLETVAGIGLASVDCSAVMHDGGATAGQGAAVDQMSHATVA